jgi:hypothetical protein
MAVYDLYLALVMVIEISYRGYSSDHEAWVCDLCDRAWLRCAEHFGT